MLEYLIQEDLVDKNCYVYRASLYTYTCSKEHRYAFSYKHLKEDALIKKNKVLYRNFSFSSRHYVLPNNTTIIRTYTDSKYIKEKKPYKQKEKNIRI